MGKYFSVILVMVLGAMMSCADKIELGDTDYIVFGQFGAYCAGESCVEFFRLETDRLFEDTSDDYNGQGFHPFSNFQQLTQAQFDIAKELESKIPTRITVEPDTFLGNQNVIDAGLLYFEWKTETQHRYWIISRSSDNLLPEYSAFADELNSLIDRLN